jgi:hypothetical protein
VDEKKREAALSAFVEYLERYYFLICFTVFLSTDAFARPSSPVNGKHWDGKEGGFQMWMKARPELYSVLRRWGYLVLLCSMIFFVVLRSCMKGATGALMNALKVRIGGVILA